jgi:hypothetical protein
MTRRTELGDFRGVAAGVWGAGVCAQNKAATGVLFRGGKFFVRVNDRSFRLVEGSWMG